MSFEQRKRLESLGDVVWHEQPPESSEQYIEWTKGADIICSGSAGLEEAYKELRDVYVTVAFVSVAFLDTALMRQNGVRVSNAPGSNRHAVTEWIVAMMISLTRNLQDMMNAPDDYTGIPQVTQGLAGQNLTILGQGNIGRHVGAVAATLGMNVSYFTRGDNLFESVGDADVVVDTLSDNPTTRKLLDEQFFANMKKGSIFVTVSRTSVVDEDALLKSLDDGHLSGAATDCASISVGDGSDMYYKKMSRHPKVIATPHIAYNSQMSMKMGNDIMIDNVEAYIAGKPQNLVH